MLAIILAIVIGLVGLLMGVGLGRSSADLPRRPSISRPAPPRRAPVLPASAPVAQRVRPSGPRRG